ncbi:MAG: class I SAM-dependent methyltransferase [Solirubrobacteraceae bacterium]
MDSILDRQRAMWSVGDYPDIARTIEPVAEEVVAAIGAGEGDRVLDVATGSGNAALAAARRGAQVTGLDLTPRLLDVARERAAAEGLDIDFVEGNAESLPFDAASFAATTSVFGAMFAPDQRAAAAELLRVTRPGGAVAVTAWTPEGANGRLFATVAKYMPPPPPGFQPPILWGVEDHVRGLFAGAEVTVERHVSRVEAESAEAWLAYTERVLGPIVLAKAALEPEGRWPALRADLLEVFRDADTGADDGWHGEAEYLLTVARRPT